VNADVLAVVCRNCLTMLEDTAKAEGLQDKIRVMDIPEILCRPKHRSVKTKKNQMQAD
jgi:Fe-S oxidoreductase